MLINLTGRAMLLGFGGAMTLRLMLRGVLVVLTSLAAAQTNTAINCVANPELCRLTVGGQVLTFGMPKDQVLGLVSKVYKISENPQYSAEHKPDSMWWLSDKEGVVKGGVKFKAEKLDGAMVVWSPDSNEGANFAANLVNVLEQLSKEGSSTDCALTTERKTSPQQEQRSATFECGWRAVSVTYDRFQLMVKGQTIPDTAEIVETFANW